MAWLFAVEVPPLTVPTNLAELVPVKTTTSVDVMAAAGIVAVAIELFPKLKVPPTVPPYRVLFVILSQATLPVI